jgi:hypothetical protein
MLFQPRKGTKGAEKIFCAFCAFLWLTLPLAAQTNASFIEDLQQRSFRYFWEQADPQTGLVPDRARIDGSSLPESHAGVASIAATGFGLTSLCIASERNWIERSRALERARNTLRFFDARAFINAAGSTIGWTRGQARVVGTAKSHQSTPPCCSQACSQYDSAFATIAR